MSVDQPREVEILYSICLLGRLDISSHFLTIFYELLLYISFCCLPSTQILQKKYGHAVVQEWVIIELRKALNLF